MLEEILNYQLIGGFRVLHLLFVAPVLYFFIYEINQINRYGMDMRAKATATILDFIGKDSDNKWQILFFQGHSVFIKNPEDVDRLFDMANCRYTEDICGTIIKFHTDNSNTIISDSLEVL